MLLGLLEFGNAPFVIVDWVVCTAVTLERRAIGQFVEARGRIARPAAHDQGYRITKPNSRSGSVEPANRRTQ